MSLNDTPSADRVHIGFFGMRNAGKSSVVNAITNQELAVVSDIKGTTTDPVTKAMELLPIGPVLIIDTPGFDDEGTLGELRIRKTKQVLNKTDVAVLVVDCLVGKTNMDNELIELFKKKNIPYLVVYNKSDLMETSLDMPDENDKFIYVSAANKTNIYELKEMIASIAKSDEENIMIVGDLVKSFDLVVLVIPVDSAAPKGRIILPQQQTLRELLDAGVTTVVIKDDKLKDTIECMRDKIKLVITDSQAFERVSKDTPEDILLTSFSILMARHKGVLEMVVKGAAAIEKLEDGDTVLISEGCTHHRQCEDIGTVKMPAWINQYTGKQLKYEFSSGTGFPDDLTKYKLIVHCGGCMLNEREVKYRMKCANDMGVAITNYGTAIAYMHGILARSIEVIPELNINN